MRFLSTLVVEEPRAVGGRVEAPSSLFYTLYSIAVSALLEGVVVEKGDWEATLTRVFISNLRKIGFQVDYSPRGGLRVEREGVGRTFTSIRAECSPLLLYLSSIVAGFALEPGVQVVVRASCSELAEYARVLAGLLYQLGVRAWPGFFPRILVVEGSRLYSSSVIRIASRDGVLASVALLASLAGRTPLRVLVQPGVSKHSRVRQAASILSSLGLRVEVGDSLVVVEGKPRETSAIEVPRGYAEAGMLAALSARGIVEVEGLSETLEGEEELLAWLRLLGVESTRRARAIVFEAVEPRSSIVDLSTTPQLLLSIIAVASALKTRVLVAGLPRVKEEHPYASRLGKFLEAVGGKVEEKSSSLIIEFSSEARPVVDCSRAPQETCSSILAGLSAAPTRSRIVVKNIDPSYVSSRLLSSLYALGAVIREERS